MDALAPLNPKRSPETYDLAFPLRRWRRNYIVALKIAELELSVRPNLDRVLKLLIWMRDDFIIAGPAALLACIYFAPNFPPRKGLFKQLRSSNRLRAIDGVRNAAWDLTHVSEVVRKVNEASNGPVRLLFASFDEGLRNLAGILFAISTENFSEKLLAEALTPWWNQPQAEQIGRLLTELVRSLNDEGRIQRQANSFFLIDDMIRQGEQFLLSGQVG